MSLRSKPLTGQSIPALILALLQRTRRASRPRASVGATQGLTFSNGPWIKTSGAESF
jgi:hypothetical protein